MARTETVEFTNMCMICDECMGGYHPPARLNLLQNLRIRNRSVRHGVACVPE